MVATPPNLTPENWLTASDCALIASSFLSGHSPAGSADASNYLAFSLQAANYSSWMSQQTTSMPMLAIGCCHSFARIEARFSSLVMTSTSLTRPSPASSTSTAKPRRPPVKSSSTGAPIASIWSHENAMKSVSAKWLNVSKAKSNDCRPSPIQCVARRRNAHVLPKISTTEPNESALTRLKVQQRDGPSSCDSLPRRVVDAPC